MSASRDSFYWLPVIVLWFRATISDLIIHSYIIDSMLLSISHLYRIRRSSIDIFFFLKFVSVWGCSAYTINKFYLVETEFNSFEVDLISQDLIGLLFIPFSWASPDICWLRFEPSFSSWILSGSLLSFILGRVVFDLILSRFHEVFLILLIYLLSSVDIV